MLSEKKKQRGNLTQVTKHLTEVCLKSAKKALVLTLDEWPKWITLTLLT